MKIGVQGISEKEKARLHRRMSILRGLCIAVDDGPGKVFFPGHKMQQVDQFEVFIAVKHYPIPAGFFGLRIQAPRFLSTNVRIH